MDEARNEFLPRPGLSLDQDGGFCPSHPPQQPQNILHLRADADDLTGLVLDLCLLTEDGVFRAQALIGGAQLGGKALVLVLQLAFLQCLAHRHAQVVGRPGLGDVLMDFAGVDGDNQVIDLGVPCENDAHHVRVFLSSRVEEFDSGHVGHFLVRDHGIDWVRLEDAESLFPGLRQINVILVDERPLQLLQVGGFVIDQEQRVFFQSAAFS